MVRLSDAGRQNVHDELQEHEAWCIEGRIRELNESLETKSDYQSAFVCRCTSHRPEDVSEEDGLKFDADKIRYDLLSPSSLRGTTSVLTIGAKKYSERNWEKGLEFGRLYRGALGHMLDWFDGEELDPESGLNHLHHAACCIHFLQHYVANPEKYKEFDNRPV